MKTKRSDKALLAYTIRKVKDFFIDSPARAHGYDHAVRVQKWAREIARGEKANVFLAEMAAILHDVGRALEEHGNKGVRHHELSYRLLRQWFRKDPVFRDGLSKEEKIILLYAIRNHWNNVADEYDIAVILRDADKFDSFGAVGVKRSWVWVKGNKNLMNLDLRFKYDCHYWIVTKTGRKILERENLMGPVDAFFRKFLRAQIKSVKL